MRFKTLISACILLTAALPRVAIAAEIVPATGKVVLSTEEFGLRFDRGELATSELGLVVYDLSFDRIGGAALDGLFVEAEADSIEGNSAIELGGSEAIYAMFDLRRIAPRFSGRRVEIRFWQHTLGTRFSATLNWVIGDVDGYMDRDDYSAVDALGYLPFQPTGRATDDGWEEWTSGPFDFSMAHVVAPAALALLDDAASGASQGISRYDTGVRARIDALTITDLGEAIVPRAQCTLVSRDQVCGEVGTCLYGQCVDAAPILGPAIHNADIRKDYLDRYALSFNTFEGGRAPLLRGADLRTALDRLNGETSPRKFREGLAIAIQDLGDGHASQPYPTYRGNAASGVCAYTSDADLLPERAELPMVFDFDAMTPIGEQLTAGDVITAIDGLPPRDWAVLARARLGYGGDPAGREVIEASTLFDAALDFGATISIARCSNATACTEDQLVRFELDLAAVAAPVFQNQVLSWITNPRTCDFRFRRAIETPAARDYAFAGSVDEDGARILQINGVPSAYWEGGTQWFSAVDLALSDGPGRVILDQRLGGGGSPDAVDRIAAYMVGADEYYAAQLFPRLAQELTPEIHARLLACLENQQIIGMCGNFQVWTLGGFDHPNVGLNATSKMAIVNGLDVSGNDFLPKMLTFRRRGETRFFGPAPTYGAFGAIVPLPALLGDYYGGSFQIQDTVFSSSPMDMALEFTTSTGIPPDERILQKQSDAVRGVDTVLEAAKAWVLQ